MKTPIILLAFALAAMPSALATAGPDSDNPTFKVSYADLDLSTPQGRAALDKRLNTAVHEVCYEAGPPSTHRQRRMKNCMTAAAERARKDMQQAVASAAPRPSELIAAAEQP